MDWQQEIRVAEEENCREFVARNVERLDRLWSDELVVNSPINRVHDKKRVLELLRTGTISHTTLECHSELTIRHDQYVIVMGHELYTNTLGGPIIRRRYTNMWRLENGAWRLIARHANLIAGETHGMATP